MVRVVCGPLPQGGTDGPSLQATRTRETERPTHRPSQKLLGFRVPPSIAGEAGVHLCFPPVVNVQLRLPGLEFRLCLRLPPVSPPAREATGRQTRPQEATGGQVRPRETTVGRPGWPKSSEKGSRARSDPNRVTCNENCAWGSLSGGEARLAEKL